MVGYFTYKDVVFPESRYMSSQTVAAAGDDRLVFFDLSTETKPQVKEEHIFDTQITAVDMSTAAVSVVRSVTSGPGLMLEVFGRNGKKAFETELDETPRYMEESENYVLMTTESGVKIWDYSGKLRFEGLLAQEAQTVFAMNRRTLVQPSGGRLYRYRLK